MYRLLYVLVCLKKCKRADKSCNLIGNHSIVSELFRIKLFALFFVIKYLTV